MCVNIFSIPNYRHENIYSFQVNSFSPRFTPGTHCYFDTRGVNPALCAPKKVIFADLIPFKKAVSLTAFANCIKINFETGVNPNGKWSTDSPETIVFTGRNFGLFYNGEHHERDLGNLGG